MRKPSMPEIASAACEVMRVSPLELRSRSRVAEISQTRALLALAFLAHGYSGVEAGVYISARRRPQTGAEQVRRCRHFGPKWAMYRRNMTLAEATARLDARLASLGCVRGNWPAWMREETGNA